MTEPPGLLPQRTVSLCGTCLRRLPARIVRSGAAVHLRKTCPDHGPQEVLLCSDVAWYSKIMEGYAPPEGMEGRILPEPPERGCPLDCGPCREHAAPTLLPILPVTSACDRACPICYTHNRNVDPWNMDEATLRAILRSTGQEASRHPMVNITGGEPTCHPRFLRLLELCREEGVRRLTLSTHGGAFLRDPGLLDHLAELGTRVILSFDSLRPAPNERLLGLPLLEAKLRILDLLEERGIPTTLLPVLVKGINEDEMAAIARLAMGRRCVRSVEFHTMTFTGQGGRSFDPSGRLDPYGALAALEAGMDGELGIADFVSHPAAHPLCYQVSYLLGLEDGSWIPFTRFMEPAVLRGLLRDSLYLEPGMEVELALQDAIQSLWAGGDCPRAGEVLATLRGLLDRLFSQDLDEEGRFRAAEERIKAVYLHTHMDEESFDTSRVRACPVAIREADGRAIPSCSYNVLHRRGDPRFRPDPASR